MHQHATAHQLSQLAIDDGGAPVINLGEISSSYRIFFAAIGQWLLFNRTASGRSKIQSNEIQFTNRKH